MNGSEWGWFEFHMVHYYRSEWYAPGPMYTTELSEV